MSGETWRRVRPRQGHGDQERDEDATSLQTHLESLLQFYFAPAHFHAEGGLVVVVSEISEGDPHNHLGSVTRL